MKSSCNSRPMQGEWRIEGCTGSGFAGVVVIPALAESVTLLATLGSLAQNPPDALARFLVLVVINHRVDAPEADKADNLATLALLAESVSSLPQLNLAWIDAATPGLELPVKGGGVGLARRIGLDLALTRIDSQGCDPILVCLDADTLVRPDYLPALIRHFERSACGAAVIPFRHQQGGALQADQAIMRYELFLRCYVLGLSLAASPYAFHSVGSAMACRASAYVKIGGMNSRSAGEDFYFLQQLARTVGIGQVAGTVVYPSQRASHRVPFGTGRSISRILDGDTGAVLFYRTECFRILAGWLALVTQNCELERGPLMARAGEISSHLAEYLDSIRCGEIWEKLRRNNPRPTAFLAAFHGWFDGLKSMKLIHHLSAGPFPRCEPGAGVPELLRWCGSEEVSGLAGQLERVRRLQLGDDYC